MENTSSVSEELHDSQLTLPPSSEPESGPLAIELPPDVVPELDHPSSVKILHPPDHPPITHCTSPRLSPALRSEPGHHCKSKLLLKALHARSMSPRSASRAPEPRSSSLKRKRAERSVSLSNKVLRRSLRLGFDNVSPETDNVDSNGGAFRGASKKSRSSRSEASVSALRPGNDIQALFQYAPRRSPRSKLSAAGPESSSLKQKKAEFFNSLFGKCPRRSPRVSVANGNPETRPVKNNCSALRGSSSKSTPGRLKGSHKSSDSEADAWKPDRDETSTKGRRHLDNCSNSIIGSGKITMYMTPSESTSLRRSPRLSPNQFIVSAMKKFNSSITNGRTLRSSPRFHSALTGDLKVRTDMKESNKVTSKKIKLPSESYKERLDENGIMQCSNIPLTKAEVDEIRSPVTILSETVEKRPPIDTEVIDPLKCESSEQGKQCPEETKVSENPSEVISFIGDPICEEEARQRWQWRYDMKSKISARKSKSPESDDDEDKIVTDVQCHYRQAEVRGCIYNLGDCATIRGEGGQTHIGRILEFFRTNGGEDYFRVQWFYRAEDTVLQDQAPFLDKRRLFYSTIENDNPLDCIIAKVKITRVTPKFGVKSYSSPSSDFYFDMEYCLEYSTFRTVPSDAYLLDKISSPPSWVEALPAPSSMPSIDNGTSYATHEVELRLLDLYSGCGGMSTGLNLGGKVSGVNIVTKWSLDYSEDACESLKLNHPETQVRNEAAEDFLQLLKEWEKLYKRYTETTLGRTRSVRSKDEGVKKRDHSEEETEVPGDELEVSSLVDICYGDPNETGKRGLKFKVRWVGYGPKDDTWEPIEGLSNCQEKIQDFVRIGLKSKILPLPGDVDVICGGPPCQGISGYNRFRNIGSPLDDDRNRQIVVFMDIVQFLKPKFVLMENVTDILRFDKASLARYAVGRLVHMKYQARLGTIAAGSYGLPQFRLRFFLWGAQPNEILPQFPLPTHDVIVRYWPPLEFERNTVAYYEGHLRDLEKASVLRDAISDLPSVTNNDNLEEMTYDKPPETALQRFLRSSNYEMTGSTLNECTEIPCLLYDHRPRVFSEDNYLRICQVPKRKGANFRDFPGVVVGADNVARPDQTQQPILLPSGKPLVPHFVYTFEQGKSRRCYGRLWWDETMPTVLTEPNCRNQVSIHPEQDRVLTIRECARLQGFPDYYRFCGSIKERYRQIGNAVAVPVSRALGYSLGMAFQKLVSGNSPNMILPPNFSYSTFTQLTNPHSSAENQLTNLHSSTDNSYHST